MRTRAAAVLVSLAVVAVGTLVGAPAGAAEGPAAERDRIRTNIEAVAQASVDAEIAVRELDASLVELTQQVADATAHQQQLRVEATARAVQLYQGVRPGIATVLSASDPIDSARRVRLVDQANEDGDAAIDALAVASEQLDDRRAELTARRQAQEDALADLADRTAELDARLATVTAEHRAAQAAAAAAAAPAPTSAAPGSSAPAGAGDGDGDGDEAAATPPPTRAPAPPTDPQPEPETTPVVDPPAPPTPGAHPRHDNAFLVCTRTRESSGNYAAFNPAGPGYYGAYQFAPSTWDATAAYAGRPELVGVLPSQASVWDQDDLAWTLYQWQGKAPWLHRC